MTHLTPDFITCTLYERNGPTVQHSAVPLPRQLTPAAVLLPLIQHPDGWQLLFIRRTQTVSHHKGQIAFPGGRAEIVDKNPMETAQRETREELGINSEQIQILGRLRPLQTTQTGFWIYPFVGLLPMEFQLHPDPKEVADILIIPLSLFMTPPLPTNETDNHYVYQKEIIWGATARMMTQFVDCLLTERPCAS